MIFEIQWRINVLVRNFHLNQKKHHFSTKVIWYLSYEFDSAFEISQVLSLSLNDWLSKSDEWQVGDCSFGNSDSNSNANGTWAPCVKFRKYFEMRQLSENTFQSFNMEVYEKIFFSWNFSFLSGQGKLLILQHIWLYIIISISKEIRPTLRLSYISVYIKS